MIFEIATGLLEKKNKGYYTLNEFKESMRNLSATILFAVLMLFVYSSKAQSWEPLTYSPNQDSLELNPLKGLTPLYNEDNGFPHSVRGLILTFEEIMNGIDNFNWPLFDDFINEQAEQGRFSYLQVNIDMGKPNVNLPVFLQNDVPHFQYIGGTNDGDNGVSQLIVDYNDEDLMLAMLNFITRFGERYNSNPRLFLVHYGLYGVFGEWDLGYGKNFVPNGEDWSMTPANQKRITDAYEAVFPDKNLLARFPENVPEPQAVGYSDGLYFGASVSDDPNFGWFFHPKLVTNNADQNWRTYPIGGEVDPYVQPTLWENFPNTVTGDPDLVGGDPALLPLQNTDTIFNRTHPTFIFQDWVFNNPLSTTMWDNAIKATKKMGYTFYISEYKLTASASKPTIEVMIQNKGIAPMYADWEMEFGYLDANDEVKTLGTSNTWNLKAIQPDAQQSYRSFFSETSLPDGTHTFLMRVINPLENIIANPSKAKPLRFANATQDIDSMGWLTLGQATLVNGEVGAPIVQVTGLTIDPTSAIIGFESPLQLNTIVLPANASNPAITWSSNLPNTASVDENGMVTSHTLEGDVIITGTTQDGAFAKSVNISVQSFWELPRRVEAEGYATMNEVGQVTPPVSEGGGKALGFLNQNSWMDYNVKVPATATYILDFRASAPYGLFGNAKLDVIKDNVVINSITFSPSTPLPLDENCDNDDGAAYGIYGTYRSTPVTLPAGTYVLRLDVVESAFNLNWIDFKLDPCENFDMSLDGTACDDGDANTEVDTYVGCECVGIPINKFTTIPTQIEAEDYYSGFNARRDEKAPAAEGCSRTLSNLGNDTWIEYPVYVEHESIFQLDLRALSPTGNFGDAIIDILGNDNLVLTNISLAPATIGDAYDTYTSAIFTLPAGYHKIRLDVVTSNFNLNWIQFKHLSSFTFHGVGDDQFLEGPNWNTGIAPPPSYEGIISIEADCVVPSNYMLDLGNNATLTVKDGATLTIK